MSLIDASKYKRQPKKDSWSQTASTAVVQAFNLFFNRRPAPSREPNPDAGAPGAEEVSEPSYIQILSPDILVDEIFPLLLIDELIRLRQTCKCFYLLTHETVIWKRYLRRLRIPIALSRPTFQYDSRISNYEIETIVTSACAIDRAWRGGFPRIRHERVLTAQCKVVDLCLLPGGKFLVASIKDRLNFRFFLCVYALDVLNGSRMLARVPTLYKAFDLQAKYMTYDDRPGIMIYYTRRRFVGGVPKNVRDNINDVDYRVHYPSRHPMIYEGICIHMRLDSVEKLIYPDFKTDGLYYNYTAHAKKLPSPFVDVFRYKDEHEIHSPSLCKINNDTVLMFAEDKPGGSNIVYVNLVKGQGGNCRMFLKEHEGFERMPHRIRAMRYLPCQKCIFVIRSVRTAPDRTDNILCEIYDLPRQNGDQNVRAYLAWSFEDNWNLSGEIVISDDADFTANTPYHPDLINHRYLPPPTIWVFAPTEKPKGCLYFYLRAVQDQYGRYRYAQTDPRPRHHHNPRFHEEALAGSLRSLILEIDKHESKTTLRRMRRFFFSETRFPDVAKAEAEARADADPDDDPDDLMTPITQCRPGMDRALVDILCSEDVGVSINKAGGLVASAWDEMSGKICVASESENCIRLLDVAPVVEPHIRLAYRWHKNLIDPDAQNEGYYPLTWAAKSSTEASENETAEGASSSSADTSTSEDVEMSDPPPVSPEPQQSGGISAIFLRV